MAVRLFPVDRTQTSGRNAAMRHALFAITLLAATPANAEPQSLRSFAYQSSGCTLVDGAPLLTFRGGQYKAATGFAAPDAGIFPDSDFSIRVLTLTYLAPPHFFWHWLWSAAPSAWALVGRFDSPDDDGWVSPAVPAGQSATINFPADAAPIFHHNGRSFFDAHVDSCREGYSLMFAIWYLPKTNP